MVILWGIVCGLTAAYYGTKRDAINPEPKVILPDFTADMLKITPKSCVPGTEEYNRKYMGLR